MSKFEISAVKLLYLELTALSPVLTPVKLATAVLASILFDIVPLAIEVILPTLVTTPVKLALVVTVSALPVILPTIVLDTVKFDNVPTLVKLEPVIVEFNVVPVKVPASVDAVIVISSLPSNATPFIFLAVANFVAVLAAPAVAAVIALVAVAAFPVTLPTIEFITVKFANVPTLVKLEPVIVDFKVVPDNVLASILFEAAGAFQIAFPEASAVNTSPNAPDTFEKSIVPSFKVPSNSNLPGKTVEPSLLNPQYLFPSSILALF